MTHCTMSELSYHRATSCSMYQMKVLLSVVFLVRSVFNVHIHDSEQAVVAHTCGCHRPSSVPPSLSRTGQKKRKGYGEGAPARVGTREYKQSDRSR